MTPHERRFRELCRGLLAIGVKPTPTKINRFMGRTGRRKLNNINGREANWRRQELIAAGWKEPLQYMEPDEYGGRYYLTPWTPPR